jgi:hypothetical protein
MCIGGSDRTVSGLTKEQVQELVETLQVLLAKITQPDSDQR